MDETRKKEPLIRIEKRKERPAKQVRLLRLASVVLAIVAGGLFILCIVFRVCYDRVGRVQKQHGVPGHY